MVHIRERTTLQHTNESSNFGGSSVFASQPVMPVTSTSSRLSRLWYPKLPKSVHGLYPTAVLRTPSTLLRRIYIDILRNWDRQRRHFRRQALLAMEQDSATRLEVQELIEENERLLEKADRQIATETGLRQTLDKLRHERDILRSSTRVLRGQEDYWMQEVEKLRSKLDDQAQMLHAAQDAAKHIMEQSRTFAMSDDDIRMRLASMTADWHDWVWQYAHKDVELIKNLSQEDMAVLMSAVSTFAVLDDDCLPPALIYGNRSRGAAGLLLYGMLANAVSDYMFTSPATALRLVAECITGQGYDEGMQTLNATAISDLIETLCRCDERTGHQTRATIIRTMIGSTSGPSPDTCNQERLEASTLKLSGEFVRSFLSGPAGFLCRHLDAQETAVRESRLVELMQQTLNLSTQLWGQKSRVFSASMRFIDGTCPLNSKYAEPHKSQLALAEDDEVAYSNLLVGMVLQPAIVAFGTEDGERYDEITRVWLRAQVWCIPETTN